MATTNKWVVPTAMTITTTALNSLTTTGNALSDEYDNSSGLYLYGILELKITYGTNPTPDSTISVYFVAAPDGTNYGTGTTLSIQYKGSFVLAAATTAQYLHLGIGLDAPLVLPPTKFKVYLKADTTGQTAAASGNTLKLFAYNSQAV